MARLPELVRGHWLDGLPDDVAHDVQSMCILLETCITDATVSLAMFEQVRAIPLHRPDREAWEREAEATRKREQELAAEDPREWAPRISERARRDVLRDKWEAGELPKAYRHRLSFIHARSL